MVTKANSRTATGFGKSQFHPSVMWKVRKRMTLELECNLNNQNVQVPEKKNQNFDDFCILAPLLMSASAIIYSVTSFYFGRIKGSIKIVYSLI